MAGDAHVAELMEYVDGDLPAGHPSTAIPAGEKANVVYYMAQGAVHDELGDERPYECLHCGERFTNCSNVGSHIRNKHRKEKPWKCNICPKTHVKWGRLHNHLKNDHGVSQPTRESYVQNEGKVKRQSLRGEYKKLDMKVEPAILKDVTRAATEKDGTTLPNFSDDASVTELAEELEIPWLYGDVSTAITDIQNVEMVNSKRKDIAETNKPGEVDLEDAGIAKNKRKLSTTDLTPKRQKINAPKGIDAEKHYECLHCGERFTTSSKVGSHITYQHKKEKPWKCNICPKTHIQWEGLHNHLNKDHGVSEPNRESYVHKRQSLRSEYKNWDMKVKPAILKDVTRAATEKDGTTLRNLADDASVTEIAEELEIPWLCGRVSTATTDIQNMEMVNSERKNNAETNKPGEVDLEDAGIAKNKRKLSTTDLTPKRQKVNAPKGIDAEKHYECLHCGERFTTASNVCSHITYQHKKEKPWKCNICPRTHVKWERLHNHLKKDHGVSQPNRESYVQNEGKVKRQSLRSEYKNGDMKVKPAILKDVTRSASEKDGNTLRNFSDDAHVAELAEDLETPWLNGKLSTIIDIEHMERVVANSKRTNNAETNKPGEIDLEDVIIAGNKRKLSTANLTPKRQKISPSKEGEDSESSDSDGDESSDASVPESSRVQYEINEESYSDYSEVSVSKSRLIFASTEDERLEENSKASNSSTKKNKPGSNFGKAAVLKVGMEVKSSADREQIGNTEPNTIQGCRSFRCSLCLKEFFNDRHLKMHSNTVHAGELPYDCGYCGKTFTSSERINKHISKKHIISKSNRESYARSELVEDKASFSHAGHPVESHFSYKVKEMDEPATNIMDVGDSYVATVDNLMDTNMSDAQAITTIPDDETVNVVSDMNLNAINDICYESGDTIVSDNDRLESGSNVTGSNNKKNNAELNNNFVDGNSDDAANSTNLIKTPRSKKKFSTKDLAAKRLEIFSSQENDCFPGSESARLGGKLYDCDHCIKNFPTTDSLTQHICLKHNYEIPWECDICPEKFPDIKECIGHLKEHGVSVAGLDSFHKTAHVLCRAQIISAKKTSSYTVTERDELKTKNMDAVSHVSTVEDFMGSYVSDEHTSTAISNDENQNVVYDMGKDAVNKKPGVSSIIVDKELLDSRSKTVSNTPANVNCGDYGGSIGADSEIVEIGKGANTSIRSPCCLDVQVRSRSLKYIEGTSQYIIETFAKKNMNTLYVVWHEVFNLDIVRSVAGNWKNTILFVNKFAESQFDLFARLKFGSMQHHKIYVGDDLPQEIHCFTFGQEFLMSNETYGYLFPDFDKLEDELSSLVSCNRIHHIIDQDWSSLLINGLKKDIIVSKF